MGIAVTSWGEIDQANYDAARALQVAVVTEQHPEVEVRGGTISDLVLALHGALGAAGRIERTRLLQSNSLQAVLADPDSADDGVVDALFGNYRVTRNVGAAATGGITLVLSRPVPTVVPAGYLFTASGREFVTVASFAARLSANDVLSSTDRVLVEQPDGTFTFSVDVQATSLGVSGMLRQGDVVALSKPIANVSRAFATNDFSGGRNAESNADLYQRLELGTAAHTWSNDTNIAALVRSQTDFEDALVSVIGAGDPEMLRDKHSLFPLAYGNRIDLWIKTQQPTVKTITKTATYRGTGADGPRWSIQLDRDDMPGVYLIQALLRSGRTASAAVAPTVFTRQFSAQQTDPDIVSALEASFSRFQSGLVEFVDAAASDDTLVTDETEVEYRVTGIISEHLPDLQTALTAKALAPPAGDLVVRGAVPCLLSVTLDFDQLPDDLPRSDIAAALAEHVNKIGFNSAVYASRLVAILSEFLPDSVNLQRVLLSGIVLGPDGSRKLYRSREALTAPNNPAQMITPATVAFYLDAGDVSFNVV